MMLSFSTPYLYFFCFFNQKKAMTLQCGTEEFYITLGLPMRMSFTGEHQVSLHHSEKRVLNIFATAHNQESLRNLEK